MKFSKFIQRFYPYLAANKLKLFIVAITVILATVLEASLPEVTGKIIDNLFNNSDELVVTYSLLIFGIIFISSALTFISVNISSLISNSVIMTIRVEMFAKLLKLPKKYFDNNDSGKILSKLTFNVEQISALASTLWIELIKSSLMVIILTTYLFWTSWQLSLSLFIIMPLIFLTIRASSIRMKNASILVQESMGDTTHHLSENITANTMVKIYQLFDKSTAKFNNLVNIIRFKRFRVDNIAAINTFVVNTLIALSLAFVVYFSTTVLNMSAGEFMAFFTAMSMLIKPAKTLININKLLQTALAAGKSIFDFFDEKEEASGKKDISIKGKIEFRNVCFSYNKRSILKGVSFTIEQGESLAFVGATGSGKSTIAALISKFYNHHSGEILIDGEKIENIKLTTLRANISLVEQKINLFTGSIKENIALGKNLNNKHIQHALKIANASNFVDNLISGIDSKIGNNGIQLSGGQAQRLSIARAVAKNAPILILDEATSALDSKTENQVQEAINKLQTGKTTIIIAHRLSTIQNADRIAVIKDGIIVEIGTHQQLLTLNKEYSKFYQTINK